MNALLSFGTAARGEIVRINVGPFRPYLVTHPDHVRHVLRANWTNYLREGVFWKPLKRLTGDSIFAEGAVWETSRRILQPLFTTRYIASLTEGLVQAIDEALDDLEVRTRSGQSVDMGQEMAHIVNRMINRVLFGSKIAPTDADRLLPACLTVAPSFTFRILLPFVPYSIPVPGDRAFNRAVKTIDSVIWPLVAEALRDPGEESDIISALARAHGSSGDGSGAQRMHDDLASVYGASIETTVSAVTWLWIAMAQHPDVVDRMVEEVDRVVGTGPLMPDHLPELRYLKMVLQETLRLYPPGWILPRRVVEDDEIGGTRIEAGSYVLLSPYVTHRLEEFWDRPLVFDPERFAASPQKRRHRYAYLPFGAGPHVCIGQHLFEAEGPLLVAGLLHRFRPVLVNPGPFTIKAGGSIHPREKVEMRLLPR